jgi:signal transduction histidine kinase
VAVKRDVTKKQKNEEKIRKLLKIEAIEILAGGIAHDLNNILAGVVGYSELALIRVGQDNAVYAYLSKILEACNHAKKLIGQILQSNHTREDDSQPCRVATVVEDVIGLLRTTLPANIKINKHIDEYGLAKIASTQMHQILMNLCTNAYHAMEDCGGLLSIFLKKIVLTRKDTLHLDNLEPGHYLHLSIQDTGRGIDTETIGKIFDPLFTTKEKNKGTGLGLNVVDRNVRNCDGCIKVYSRIGVGTTFDVYVPMVSNQVCINPKKIEVVSEHKCSG